MAFGNFMDLEMYKKGRVLRNEIEDMTEKFPSKEQYRLTDQIVRSSRSVTANIAEGHGRYHYKEFIQRCRTSRAEAVEVIDHLTVALDRKYIDDSTYEGFKNRYRELEKMINGYIAYLQKRLNEGKS